MALRPRCRGPVLSLFALLAACGGDGTSGTQPPDGGADLTPPTVASTVPADAASNAATTSTVTAVFSEAMDALTLDTGSFTLEDAVGNSVAGTVAVSGGETTATFTPSSALATATTYTATVTTGAQDAAGNPLASDHVWTFTTQGASDTTPPTVSATSPANGATAVATSSVVSATFSEAMNASTITTGTFTLRDASSNAVSGSVAMSGGNTVATFTPGSALADATTYTAAITTGAQDAAGNALASEHAWTFTTQAAAPAPTHYVFLTATTHNGNLGGLSGADQICQARAVSAGLPGTWRAWLSVTAGSTAIHAKDRFSDVTGGWKLPGTSTVAVATKAEISNLQTTAALDRDENGTSITPQPQYVWSGTSSGGVASGSACTSWTSATSAVTGTVYLLGSSTSISPDVRNCSSVARLLCLQQ